MAETAYIPPDEVIATPKQRAVVNELLSGKVGTSMATAMKNAGYAHGIVRNPQKVVQSKGFNQLLEKYLPDNKLLKKHKEFINAKKTVRTFTKGDLTTEVEETDANAVKALDMAYKLKGKYMQGDTQNNVLVVQLSDSSAGRYGDALPGPTPSQPLPSHDSRA